MSIVLQPRLLLMVFLAAGLGLRAGSGSAAPSQAGSPPAQAAPFWAFQPAVDHPVPEVRNPGWARTPLDHFILAALEKNGVTPSAPADKRTLLRRATFDLTGLPPTPAEMAAFLADTSTGAFARVIDRLLQSPHYGERWGRHWLDVARYADSNGLDENAAHGNAWRYRNYVIGSFNRDKPYDQFLIEQIAGDLMEPCQSADLRHERLKALGFLAIGPKVLAEPDKVKMELDIIDEQIDALGRAVTAVTLGCARCHDHKFDPFTTEDYYGLVAIFKSTRTMDDLKTIAKWHEPVVATEAERTAHENHVLRVNGQKAAISNLVARANQDLLAALKTNALPKNPESLFPAETAAQLKALRESLARLERETPELPSTMGVTESTNILKTFPVLMRGNHMTPGKEVPRHFPKALAPTDPSFADRQSGRLELARWLASPNHPLTARVMVNRIWRWHFGAGIVATPDNFGRLGERPSHPELLDWLALRFVEGGWSVKAMHRLIMNSAVYQQGSGRTEPNHDGTSTPDKAPADNRLLARFPARRLGAEEIRDAMLMVSGLMDWSVGERPLGGKNRDLVFDHTSTDHTSYASLQRSVYMPVIRNHVYDVFELLDFPDPGQQNGDRATTTVPAQALFFMNSELVTTAARALAARLTAQPGIPDRDRIKALYQESYARNPTPAETDRALRFLDNSESLVPLERTPPTHPRRDSWAVLCQVILSSNEFVHIE